MKSKRKYWKQRYGKYLEKRKFVREELKWSAKLNLSFFRAGGTNRVSQMIRCWLEYLMERFPNPEDIPHLNSNNTLQDGWIYKKECLQ
jgi:hypothetical protein